MHNGSFWVIYSWGASQMEIHKIFLRCKSSMVACSYKASLVRTEGFHMTYMFLRIMGI
jgi:hypothetical protein